VPQTVGEILQKMTLDILGNCIFGKDLNFMEEGEYEGPLASYNKVSQYASKNRAMMFFSLLEKLPFTNVKKIHAEIDKLDEFLKKLINENNDEDNNLLTYLKESKMTYEKMRDNVLIFFIAGHETTESALLYFLYNLSKHPQIQEKVREEIKRVFPNDIDPENLRDLKFMEHVINETMRLYPPVTTLTRTTKEDTVFGDYFIPKDTFIYGNVYMMHRNKDVWGDDADEFRPERWENINKDQRSSYRPFGGGPRICVGNIFSLFEQKLFITLLLKKFKITLTEDSRLVITNQLFLPKSEFLKYIFEKV